PERKEEVPDARVAEDVRRPRDVDLPDDVRRAEAGDDERPGDAQQPLLHAVKRAWTPHSASIASATSASECAGESGSDSTAVPARSATGSGGCSGNRSRYAVSRCTG